MFSRLLTRLQPQRRQLTTLVGLLALTFILTAILAYHARRSELRLQRLADARLTEASAQAAQAWSGHLQERAAATIADVAARIGLVLLRSPENSLRALEDDLLHYPPCGDCATGQQVTGYFAIAGDSSVERVGAAAPDEVLRGVWRQIVGQAFVQVHPQLGVGMRFVAHAGRIYPIGVIAVLDATGQPQRAYGYVLTDHAAREMVAYVFRSAPRVLVLGGQLPVDSVFSFGATVASAPLLVPSVSVPPLGRAQLQRAPISGLDLEVGILPGAEASMALYTPSAARTLILIALLALVGGLLLLALLLLRHEAQLVRLRADFVSSVSHELRTPLAQIRMFTETLLLGRVRSDVERRRSLEIIEQEAHRLTHLVENVLLFAKTERGAPPRLKPEPTPFALEVRRAVESFAPMCRMRNVEVRPELDENIAAHLDRGALRQILVNLIDNALKYGPAGQRVTVGAALFGESARLWVDDEGPGVPEMERERIFEAFVRMDREIDARKTGSGIGLAVVRELARLHGGRAWVEAAPGGGARFLVEFPDAFLRTTQAAPGLAAAS